MKMFVMYLKGSYSFTKFCVFLNGHIHTLSDT